MSGKIRRKKRPHVVTKKYERRNVPLKDQILKTMTQVRKQNELIIKILSAATIEVARASPAIPAQPQQEQVNSGAKAGEKPAEEKPCWEANPGCGDGQCRPDCPSWINKTTCTKFDWKDFFFSMLDEDKQKWLEFFNGHCPSCAIYMNHQKELDKVMKFLSRGGK